MNRAVTTAAVKSFVGLGGISVSEFYRTLFGRPTRDPGALRCLLLWSGVNLLCATIAIVAMPARLGRLHTSAPAVGNDMVVLAPPAEPKRALHAVVVEIAVLGMLSIVTPLMPDGAAHDAMVALMVGMALLPIALALGVGRKRGALLLDMPASASVPLAGESAEAPPPPPPVARQQTEALQQFTFVEMVRTPEAWLLWYAGTVLIGAGGFIVTQVSFIIHAAGAESTFRGHAVTSAVTIFSASNLLGRLAFPLLSDALFARRGRARPWMVAAIQLTMATAQLLFLLLASPACAHRSGAQSALILLASALGGLSFGAIWPHLVILSSEIFGSTHLTTNYLFLDGGGGAIGNVVLGALVPSIIYQRALNRAMPTAGGLFDDAAAAHRRRRRRRGLQHVRRPPHASRRRTSSSRASARSACSRPPRSPYGRRRCIERWRRVLAPAARRGTDVRTSKIGETPDVGRPNSEDILRMILRSFHIPLRFTMRVLPVIISFDLTGVTVRLVMVHMPAHCPNHNQTNTMQCAACNA